MITVLDQRTSRSIQRYTNIIIDTYHGTCLTLPNHKFKWLIYFQKYVWLPFRLVFASDKFVFLPSENYAYLLPFLFHKKTVIVCHDLHDLMNIEVPNWRKCFQKITLGFIKLATDIVCISQHTKEDLLKVLNTKMSAKIKVVHNPIELFWFEKVSRPVKIFDQVERKFILLVGTNAWYKNLDFAMETLLCIDCQIIKVGDLNPSWKEDIDNCKLLHFDSISDKELQWLYQNATLFVFPSIHEGFGWPVLEAMASGCPVVASDKASIREVGGDTIRYFNPYDGEELKDMVNNQLSNISRSDVNKSVERAQLFNITQFKRKLSDSINLTLRVA